MAPTPESQSSDATIVGGVPAERSFASGRYVVRRVLPEGGQKTVYVVHDSALDRECALALIKTDALEPEELERLRREAQAMARLDHPNIVAVYDIGEEDGRPFFVCQYITGGDLQGALRAAGGPLPTERTLGIAEDLCRALAYAHEHGIVHRDVKPANVWLTGEGTAKLGDFGLAFSLDRSRLTMPGTVMGTAAYLSPEQALGEPVTERSDLYSLGCLLYEMVCGRPPFADANPTAVIAQHLNAAPAAPSSHKTDVPPALEELILRLLAKPPDLRPESAAVVLEELRAITESLRTPEQPVEPQAEEPEPPPATPGFVGRTPEQEQLAAALDRTVGGAGSLVMVVGEPGIGKTRLLEQFAAHARVTGARVLNGHCYDGDWAPPFSPFVEAIKQHATTTSAQRLRANLGPDAGVLARIVPALRERLPNIAEPPAIPAEGERYRLLGAVSDTLGRLAAERPLVLVLDDLHWADNGTIAMLQQVARTSATQRVLVLGAYRDVELDRTHPLADALAGLRREKNFERIGLRGLDGAEVAELLDAIAEQDVPAALSEAIARETGGNPFFIKEVLLHLVEERKIVQEDGTWTSKLSIAEMGIPEGVREVIGRRLSRVSETCGRMLTVASALTAGFSWEVISALMDAGDAALLDAVDEALGAQLIVERERGRYDFTHALIRHTLYEELSTPRRVLLHRRIGEALERLYAGDIEEHLGELAHHFYECASGGDVEKAIDYARRAGDRAMTEVAWEGAAANYERALQTLELLPVRDERRQAELLLALGDARWGAGDREGSREAFARAADVARRTGDSEAFASAALGFASPFLSILVVDPQLEGLLEEALELLPPGDSAPRAMATARLAQGWNLSDQQQRIALAQEGLEMARRVGDRPALAYTMARVMFTAVWSGAGRFTELIDEGIRLAEETGDKVFASSAYLARIGDSLQLGERDAVDAAIDTYEQLAGELRIGALTSMFRAMQALLDGRLDAVEGLAQLGFVDFQRVAPQNAQVFFGAQVFDLRRAQGRLAEMEPVFKTFADQFPLIPSYRAALALVYQEQDRREETRAVFDELAKDDFAAFPDDGVRPISLVLLADVCCYLDDQPRAAALYEKLLPLADQCIVFGSATVSTGSASAPLGVLAATLGRFDDAERHFADAIAMNRKLRAPTWVAQAQLGYARMLRKRGAAGDAARALELLQLALDAAQEMGMKKVVEDCEALKAQAQAM